MPRRTPHRCRSRWLSAGRFAVSGDKMPKGLAQGQDMAPGRGTAPNHPNRHTWCAQIAPGEHALSVIKCFHY